MGDDLRADLAAYRESTGKRALWHCDFPTCDRTVADGAVLRRVNPKGQPGIFECGDHPQEDR